MSRELKRVALDFCWPQRKVWGGYLNQHYRECASCGGRGSTRAAQRLETLVRLLMLSGEDARRGRNHPYFTDPHSPLADGIVPSPELAELTDGLAGRPPRAFGHDTFSACRKIIEAAGLDAEWGKCQPCAGEGVDPASKDAYANWRPTEPPGGEGYQLWETVSEGSPVSPVFATAEDFVQFLRSEGHSEHAAWRFIETGWAPSAVIVHDRTGSSIHSNIDALDLPRGWRCPSAGACDDVAPPDQAAS